MFKKYKEILVRVLNDDDLTSHVLSQEPNTFTQLPLYVSKKDLINVDSVKEASLESYIETLNNMDFYSVMVQSLLNLDNDVNSKPKLIRVMMTRTLEKASEDNVWINDLHEADYEEILSSIIDNFQI